MNYEQVTKALAAGADPDMLCGTCPWDRNCLMPPEMTRAEVDAKIADATSKQDEEQSRATAKGHEMGISVGALMTVLLAAGADSRSRVCPVLAMRLRLPEGRGIVDALKSHMQRIGGAS